jgi:hypothetical protein
MGSHPDRTSSVKKLLTTVPARWPGPQDFVRVHPAPEYRENFTMIGMLALIDPV